MRIFQLLQHTDIIKFDVEKLVDGFKRAFNADVVFELDDNFLVHESFEETVWFGY